MVLIFLQYYTENCCWWGQKLELLYFVLYDDHIKRLLHYININQKTTTFYTLHTSTIVRDLCINSKETIYSNLRPYLLELFL